MPKVNKVTVALMDSLNLNDKLTVPTERKFKPETGQMIAPCTIARVGIMNYRAGDCGDLFADRDPNSMVKVMTTEASLFDEATLESARSAPVTVGHPDEDVTTENAKELQKGSLEGMPIRVGDELSATVIINDADTIAIVQEQADELSIGQTCDLMLADEASDWDAEKVNIRINHVAIVHKGRAGSARINDGITMYDQDHVDGMQAKLDSQDIKLADSATKVEELTTKLADAEAKLEEAKDVALSDAVEARIELITQARLLDKDLVSKGKTNAEIRLQAATKNYQGSVVLADESEAYVKVIFDMALDDHMEDNGVSDVQSVLNDEMTKPVIRKGQQDTPQVAARKRMIARQEGKE